MVDSLVAKAHAATQNITPEKRPLAVARNAYTSPYKDAPTELYVNLQQNVWQFI